MHRARSVSRCSCGPTGSRQMAISEPSSAVGIAILRRLRCARWSLLLFSGVGCSRWRFDTRTSLVPHLAPPPPGATRRQRVTGRDPRRVVPDADARWVTHVPTSRISASPAPRRLADAAICSCDLSQHVVQQLSPRRPRERSRARAARGAARHRGDLASCRPPAGALTALARAPSIEWLDTAARRRRVAGSSAGGSTRHAAYRVAARPTREALLAHAVFERSAGAIGGQTRQRRPQRRACAGAGDDATAAKMAPDVAAGAPAAGRRGSSGFDIVHFVDCAPLALYALLAQQQRLALCGCAIAVHAHAPLRWRLQRDSDALRPAETASARQWSAGARRLAGGAMDAAEAAGRGNGSKAGGAPRAAHLLLSSASIGQWLRLAGQLEAGTATLAPSPVGAVLAPILEMCSTGTGADAAGAGAGRLGGFAGKAGEHEATVAERVLRLQMDWASSTEVSLVCNALTLLHRRWRSEPPAPNSVRIEFATRTAGLGPRRDPLRGSASYDGRAALAEHARRQRWWLPWTFAESQSRVDAPQKRTLRLLLLPLLSSSAAAQLINAARCRLPLLTIAAGGNSVRCFVRATAAVDDVGCPVHRGSAS